MRILKLSLAVLLVAAAIARPAPAAEDGALTAVKVTGKVEAGSIIAGDWGQLSPGGKARKDYDIKSGPDGRALLTWFSANFAVLSTDSTLTVFEISGGAPSAEKTVLNVSAGTVFFKAALLPSPDSAFNIKTPAATVSAATAAEFSARVSQSRQTTFSVISGQVSVEADGVSVVLDHGYSISIEFGQPPGEIKAISTDAKAQAEADSKYVAEAQNPEPTPAAQPAAAAPTAPPAQTPPAAKPPKTEPQPATEPVAQPTAQPAAQPAVQPATQPVAQPTAEPVVQPTTPPAAEPAVQPVAEPAAQPAAQSAPATATGTQKTEPATREAQPAAATTPSSEKDTAKPAASAADKDKKPSGEKDSKKDSKTEDKNTKDKAAKAEPAKDKSDKDKKKSDADGAKTSDAKTASPEDTAQDAAHEIIEDIMEQQTDFSFIEDVIMQAGE